MVRWFSIVCAWSVAVVCLAQSPKEEFRKNLCFSAGSFLAYPGPQQQKLTPAPSGKRPFYISHYGRHGSRHHTRQEDYDYPLNALRRAENAGCLTALGRDVLARLEAIKQNSNGHLGELTELGQQQHRDIMMRMFERFPDVFKGDATVDARSTLTVRCVMSMSSALLQLLSLNPKLNIRQQASQSDLYYLSNIERDFSQEAVSKENRTLFGDYCQKHQSWQRLIPLLFNDTAYINSHVNGERLNYYLFRLASILQDTDLRNKITLYDLFTDEEVYENWAKENAYWFLGYGFCPSNGGRQPFSQRHLLRNIIETADSCLRLPRPGATLRFGHDTILLPLVCLLGINNYDKTVTDPEQLERHGWVDYRVIPMAGNIQFVFYRKNPADNDVVFKVLLNESEATLPLKTDMPPYYRWSDFRDYYLQRINSYEKEHRAK